MAIIDVETPEGIKQVEIEGDTPTEEESELILNTFFPSDLDAQSQAPSAVSPFAGMSLAEAIQQSKTGTGQTIQGEDEPIKPTHIGEVESALVQGSVARGFDAEDKARRIEGIFGENSYFQDEKGNFILNLDNINDEIKDEYNLPKAGSIFVNQPGLTKYDVSNFFAKEIFPLLGGVGAGVATTGMGAFVGVPIVALASAGGKLFDEVVVRDLERQERQEPKEIMKDVGFEALFVGVFDTVLRGIAKGVGYYAKGRGAEPDQELVDQIKARIIEKDKVSEAKALKQAIPIAREAQALSMRQMIDEGARIPVETLSGKSILGRTQSILEQIFKPNKISTENRIFVEKQINDAKLGLLDKEEALENINRVIDPIIENISVRLQTDDAIKIARQHMDDILQPQLKQLEKAFEVDPNLSAEPFLDALDSSFKLFNMHTTNLYGQADAAFKNAGADAKIDLTDIKDTLSLKGLGPEAQQTTMAALQKAQLEDIDGKEIIKVLTDPKLTTVEINQIPLVRSALRSTILDPNLKNSPSANLIGDVIKQLDEAVEAKKLKSIEQNKPALQDAINKLEEAQEFYKTNIEGINSGINNAIRAQIKQGFAADGKQLVNLFVSRGEPNKLKNFLNSITPSAFVKGQLAQVRKTGDDVLEQAARDFDLGTTKGIEAGNLKLTKAGFLKGSDDPQGRFKFDKNQNFLKFPEQYKALPNDPSKVGGQLKQRATREYAETLRLYDQLSKRNIDPVSFKESFRKKLAGEWIDTNKGTTLKELSNAFENLGEATGKQLFGKDYGRVKQLMNDFAIDDLSQSGRALETAALEGVKTSTKGLDEVLEQLKVAQLQKTADSQDAFLKSINSGRIADTDKLVSYVLDKNNTKAFSSLQKELSEGELDNFKTAVVQRLLPVKITADKNTIAEAIKSGEFARELTKRIQKDKNKLVEILGKEEVNNLSKIAKQSGIVSDEVLKGQTGLAAAAFSAGFAVSVLTAPVTTIIGAAGMFGFSKLLRTKSVMKVLTSKRLRGKAAEKAQRIADGLAPIRAEGAQDLADEKVIDQALTAIRQVAIQAQQEAQSSGLERLEQETRPIREQARQVTAPITEEITEEVQNVRPQASTLNLPDTGNFAPLANQQPRPVAPGMGTGEQLLAAIEREKALGLRSS